MINYPLTTMWSYGGGHLGAEMGPFSSATFNYACTSAADPDTCTWPPGTEDPPTVTPVDAVCGTADNATNGCATGNYQDTTTPGWTCQGVGGGTDASCGTTSCHSCSSQVDWYHDEIWRDIADVHPNFRVLTLNSESGTYDHPEYFWDYQYPSNYTCEQAENHWIDAWVNAATTFQTHASQCEPLSCQDVFGDNRLVGAFPDCSCPSGYIWTLDGTSITGGVCTPIIDGYCLSSNWSVGYGEFCQTGTYVNTPEPGWICQGEPGGTDAICN